MKRPDDYQRLLADYAYAKLAEKADTSASLERLAAIIGRVRATGLAVDRISVSHLYACDDVWFPPLEKINGRLMRLYEKLHIQLERIFRYKGQRKRLNQKEIRIVRSAMHLAVHLSFLNEGLPTEAQARQSTFVGLLSRIAQPEKRSPVDVPGELVPQLLLVYPRFRGYLGLLWVPWDRLD